MSEYLVKRTLPEDALSDLEQLREWLLEVDYEPAGSLQVCADQNLVPHSAKLLGHLPDEIKVGAYRLFTLSFRTH
jgi:hypothetical protein